MTFSYDSKLMAQALSVVAEAGIHGMKYNGLLEGWPNEKHSRKSNRMRWSLVSAHPFSGREFEDYLILAWRFGFLERSKYKELTWKHGVDKSAYPTEDEIIRLTREGWEFIEKNDRPVIHRWVSNTVENVPTIVVSLIAALLTSWVLYSIGAPK